MRSAVWNYSIASALFVLALAAQVPIRAAAQAGAASPATPAEMVATYQTLADAILAVESTEENLVRSILSAAHSHAQVELSRSQKAIKAGDTKAAQAAMEDLAAYVAQLGTEGDNAVAAVRKRLLEGGHHHNADAEAKGIYDQGYVIVTRVAKQAFLDSSRAIGQMAAAPKAEPLDAEWKKVEATWASLMK